MNNSTNSEKTFESQIVSPATITNIVLINVVQSAIIENYMSGLINIEVFNSLESAIYLIGLDYATIDDDLLNQLENVLIQKEVKKEDLTPNRLREIAEEILEDWSNIINQQ